MKKLIIILNIALLTIGNNSFLHSHIHGNSHEEIEHECIECLTIDNNTLIIENNINNYNFSYKFFINDKYNIYVSFKSNNTRTRAPPNTFF